MKLREQNLDFFCGLWCSVKMEAVHRQLFDTKLLRFLFEPKMEYGTHPKRREEPSRTNLQFDFEESLTES